MADGDKVVISNNNEGKDQEEGGMNDVAENGGAGGGGGNHHDHEGEGDHHRAEEEEPELKPEEAKQIGEETVDEVISLAEKADALKEHDVLDEEKAEEKRLQDELDKELRENDGWVKILGNEELMKKVIKKGEPHRNPMRGDMCTIRIEGKLADDETVVFEKNERLQLQLGDAEVVTGLDLSIPLMTKGEVATIKVSGRFGYGTKGNPPSVPPDASLVYEVELLDSEPEKELTELTVSKRREIGNHKRERGNWWFQRGETSLAVNCYRRALEFLDEAEGGIQMPDGKAQEEITPEVRQMFEDRLKTLNNMAMAQLKLQSYEPALNSVEAVLKCQPNNVKALFRKGKILGAKGETERALQALQKAKSLEPNDSSIAAEIAKLSQRKKKEYQSEKQLYKRMFKDASKTEETDKKSGSKIMSSALLLTGAVAVAAAGIMAYRYKA